MPSITAVEFDGDTCAMARTAVRGSEVTVSAAELLHPASFPGTQAFVAALRKARRTANLPRRCRVVLWGLPDGATPRDPGAASALAPLKAAGFKVERVVTPCNALGALARLKAARGEDATCWVAINTGGVAIAAIRPGRQLYSRSFGWDSSVGSSGSQARLLQRYSLVAFLAPEIKRAMTAANAVGSPVRAVVTCGNLPDLRSLTMPLIEELDVEVETLDSLDGLTVKPAAMERLTETAAAIRLACAGAVARATRPWDDAKRVAAERTRALTSAAALLLVLGGCAAAYTLYDRWLRPEPTRRSPVTRTAQAPPARPAGTPQGAPGRAAQPQPPPAGPSRGPATPAVTVPPQPAPSNSPVVSVPAEPPKSRPPAVSVPAQAAQSNPPAVSVPAQPAPSK